MVYSIHSEQTSRAPLASSFVTRQVGYMPRGWGSVSYRNALTAQVLNIITEYALHTRRGVPRLEIFYGDSFVLSAGSINRDGSRATWIDPLQRLIQVYGTAQRAAAGHLGLDTFRNMQDYGGTVLTKEDVRLLLSKRLPRSQGDLYATLDALFCRPKEPNLKIWTNERDHSNGSLTISVSGSSQGMEAVTFRQNRKLPIVLENLTALLEARLTPFVNNDFTREERRRRLIGL